MEGVVVRVMKIISCLCLVPGLFLSTVEVTDQSLLYTMKINISFDVEEMKIPGWEDSRHAEPIYSHSMVPGGLEVTSYTTRLIPATSLMMRRTIRSSTSGGKRNQSAVMKSVVVTARRARTWS